ncbi:PREDICTED: 2S sulfur-rich seed storage protein 1-like [Ipomoea nil]|uniref:2S sulfur-rich seed storage protein 1-like n=1 Tax=Ipomoea nil TaxID=35883 RepID=UPI000901D718|nr:PREDICTED: 2S sulfur-rich seed storage protein 1-like [Ipomoea nil]
MAKILALVAVLGVLLAMAEAGKQQQCRQQIESREQQLSHCENYLSQKGKNNFELAEEEEEKQPPPQECCRALRSFNRECRCAAVREAFGRQLEKDLEESGGWVEQRKMQRALQKAKLLPRSCNMQQPQECKIRPPMVL